MKISIERHHHAATRIVITDTGPKPEVMFARVQELLTEATLPIMAKDSQFHFTVANRETDGKHWIEVMINSKLGHLADATAAIRQAVHGHIKRKGHTVELKTPEVPLPTPEVPLDLP